MRKLVGNLSYANVMATVAVFIVLGGGAYALTNRDKQQIKKIAKKQASKLDKKIELRPGPKGDQGAQGIQGPPGPPGQDGQDGVDGQDGSTDTAGEVLAKLLTVDGAGSLLDADLLDGKTASDFLATDAKAADADKLDNLDSSDFVQVGGAQFTDVGLPDFDSNTGCPVTNGWVDAPGGASVDAVGYYRDPFGMVYLRGKAWRCGSPGSTVLTLPAGYRPEFGQDFIVSIDSSTSITDIGHLQISDSGDVVPDTTAVNDRVSFSGVVFRCGPSGSNGCP